jgi:ribosomal protein S5
LVALRKQGRFEKEVGRGKNFLFALCLVVGKGKGRISLSM